MWLETQAGFGSYRVSVDTWSDLFHLCVAVVPNLATTRSLGKGAAFFASTHFSLLEAICSFLTFAAPAQVIQVARVLTPF